MIGAFAFLIATSTRNKILSQLKRLRNPRYALALLFGLAYFGFVFFNRSSRSSRGSTPAEFFDPFITLLPLALLLVTLYMWLFGKDKTALAFTQAEVSLLFTAPVSRRALIIYKLARSQAAVLSTSVIWVLILNHGNRPLEHALAYWLMLSTVSLHRLGIALVRTSQAEHGLSGLRRSLPVMVVGALAIGAVGWGFYTHYDALMNAYDGSELRRLVVALVQTPPVSWALLPFRTLIAPTFSSSSAVWLAALPGAVVLFLLHFLWVLHSDAAFEEAAVEASAHRARWLANRRSRSVAVASVSPKSRRRTLKLSPTGAPAVAIFWKNFLWLQRTGQLRALIGLPVVCAVLAVGFAGRSTLAEIMVFAVCTAIGGLTFLFGPMTMRNDLRGELSRIAILKTLPLPGKQVMMAEVASSALPTAMMQYLLTLGALLAFSHFPKAPMPASVAWGIVFGAPLTLAGMSVANFTIHNGLALLFPAWVKTGDVGVSGIETMGQTMLTAIVTLVILAVLLIAPAVGGAVGYFTLRGAPVLGIAAAGIAGGLVLGLESYVLMSMLGGQLDRLEPGDR